MDISLRRQVGLTIRALNFLFEETLSKYEPSELSMSQRHLLWIISTNRAPISMKEISDRGRWHKSTVTRLIQPLLDKNYVQIETVRHNFKKVSLTKKGRVTLQNILPEIRQDPQFPFDLTGLSETDLKEIIRIGSRILENHHKLNHIAWIQSSETKVPIERQ